MSGNGQTDSFMRSWQNLLNTDLVEMVNDDACLQRSSNVLQTAQALAYSVEEWKGFSYHNSLHHREVFFATNLLIEISRKQGTAIDDWEETAIKLAALVHDIFWNKGKFACFEQERTSAAAFVRVANLYNLPTGLIDASRALVLATAPEFRGVLAGRSVLENVPPELEWMLAIPQWHEPMKVISDADIFGSCALGEENFWHKSKLIAQEKLECPTREGAIKFFEHIVGDHFLSKGATKFNASLDRLISSIQTPNIPSSFTPC